MKTINAYHGQAWWWGMAVLLCLVMAFSGCYTEVATVEVQPMCPYRVGTVEYQTWWSMHWHPIYHYRYHAIRLIQEPKHEKQAQSRKSGERRSQGHSR